MSKKPENKNDPLERLCALLVEAFLPTDALRQYQAGDIAKAYLEPIANTVKSLSSAYVGERTHALPTVTNQEAAAYALYFTPINYTKIFRLLKTLDPQFQPKRILDFGCGPATASIAALDRFTNIAEINLVDNSPAMLDAARKTLELYTKHSSRPGLQFTYSGPATTDTKYDLIIAANALNELSPDKARATLNQFSNSLTENGAILLLEPALQDVTRAHMAHRDWMTQNHPELTIIFPCTRSDSCPMLKASTTDWCHGTMSWERPRLTLQLDKLTEFNKHRIKYSAFVFQRGAKLREGLRVMRPTEKNKHSYQIPACGQNFFGLLNLKRRDKTEQNSCVTHAKEYDRLVVSSLSENGANQSGAIEISDSVSPITDLNS